MKNDFVLRIPRKWAGAALAAAVLCAGISFQVRGDDPNGGHSGGGRGQPLMSQSLPDIPGKQLTAVLVTYEPGGKSPAHRHAGDVFGFVIAGAIRSENSATGPARVYQAGEGFFEPAGSRHLVSENASATEPARLLAVFVADAHAQLTTLDK